MKSETPEQEKKNKRLLVPIPYSEVQKALDRFMMSEQLRESTLVTKYAPREKKAISPSALKWPKLVHEMTDVTTAVLPKREPRSAQPSASQEADVDEPSTPPPSIKKKKKPSATAEDQPPAKKNRVAADAAAAVEDDGEPPIQYTTASAEDRRRFLQGTTSVEAVPVAADTVSRQQGAKAYKMRSMKEVREVDVVDGSINSELDFGVFKAPSWGKKAVLTVEYLP